MIKFLLIFLFVCHCHNVLSSRIFLSFVFTSPLFLPSLPTPFFLSHLFFFFSLSFFFLSLKERYGTKIDSRIPFFILSLLPPPFLLLFSLCSSLPVQLSHTAFDATLLSLAPAHRLLWTEIGSLPYLSSSFFFWSCNMVILEATQLPPNVRVGDKYREWAPWSQS